jgi:hypothetical protein
MRAQAHCVLLRCPGAIVRLPPDTMFRRSCGSGLGHNPPSLSTCGAAGVASTAAVRLRSVERTLTRNEWTSTVHRASLHEAAPTNPLTDGVGGGRRACGGSHALAQGSNRCPRVARSPGQGNPSRVSWQRDSARGKPKCDTSRRWSDDRSDHHVDRCGEALALAGGGGAREGGAIPIRVAQGRMARGV